MAGQWANLKVDGSVMPLYTNFPSGERRVPGIVVIHGQSGLEEFVKETTQMLAFQGYAAVAPNLYHRDRPDCNDENPVRQALLRGSGACVR